MQANPEPFLPCANCRTQDGPYINPFALQQCRRSSGCGVSRVYQGLNGAWSRCGMTKACCVCQISIVFDLFLEYKTKVCRHKHLIGALYCVYRMDWSGGSIYKRPGE